MIRRVLLTAALLLGVAAAPARPDWTRVAARSAAGGIVVGNPAAKVKLVEIANYTCSHCADFARESAATLGHGFVRGGTVSYEIRQIAFDPVGLAAAVTARCAPPARFLAVNDALFARQDEWAGQAGDYLAGNADRLDSYPELDRLRTLVERGGIGAVAIAAGLPQPRLAACFADRGELDRTLVADAAAKALADGTPTFVINGQKLPAARWPAVEARLRALGAR